MQAGQSVALLIFEGTQDGGPLVVATGRMRIAPGFHPERAQDWEVGREGVERITARALIG